MPIYKNRRAKNNPQNYRPITTLICIGNLFTSIMNKSLNIFSDKCGILYENKAEFRKDYSTIDNIFSIHILFELIKVKKKSFTVCL